MNRFAFLAIAIVLVVFSSVSSVQAAWWNPSYIERFSASFVLAETAEIDGVLQFEHIDFSAYNFSCIDLNDMHVVNDTTGLDLNISIEGTSDMTDGNVSVKLDEQLVAGTYTNKLYFYFNNSNCAAPITRALLNDVNSFNDWTFETSHANVTTSIQTYDNNMGNTIKFVTNGGGTTFEEALYPNATFSDDSFGIWMKCSQCSQAHSLSILFGTQGSAMRIRTPVPNHFDFVGNGQDWEVFQPSVDTWYYVIFEKIDSTHVSISAFDEFGTSVGTPIVNKESAGGNVWGDNATITVRTSDEAIAMTTVYNGIYPGVDNFPFVGSLTGITLGAAEGLALGGFDVNLLTIKGENIADNPTISFGIDGNASIGFKVFDIDNNRITVDLNYSATSTNGTGVVIADDLNLDSSVCVDQDWSDGASLCFWDWDFSDVADGNYFLLLRGHNGASFDFNSAGPVNVASDVNLLIQIPIDEATGIALDMDKYSFTVQILDGNSVASYPDQVDANYFQIPLGTDYFVIISIDTNISTDYYGRQYYIKYETAITSDTLQPYLVPVTGGIESVFYTKNAVDLQVIPNILIKAFVVLPGVGRTETQRVETDAAGTGVLSFVEGDSYELEIFDADGVFLFTKTIVANFTAYYIYIDTGAIDLTEPTIEYITILGVPDNRRIAYVDGVGYDFNIDVNIVEGTLATAWYTITNDDGNLYFDMNNFADFNVTLARSDVEDNMEVRLIVYVVSESGLVLQQHWAFIPYDGSGYNLVSGLSGSGLRQEFACSIDPNEPCFFLLMLSAFITIAVIASAGVGITTDMNSLGILAMICLALFTYLTWIPTGFFILACLAAFAGLVLSRRGF